MPALEQVVAELRVAFPDRVIATDFELKSGVNCDRARIGQLFSNLLANALTYSTPNTPVRVHASIDDDVFELWVANQGEPIPPAAMGRLFAPYARGEVMASQQGLGLGLYIASEIARAHDGTLTVTSTPQETRFVLRIPAG